MDGMKLQAVGALASVVVAFGTVLAITGCVTEVACPAIGVVNAVFLDASPWLAAHPNGRLRACFDGRCQRVAASIPEPVTLEALSAHPSRPRLLTVKSSGTTDRVQISEAIKLSPRSVGSSRACQLTAWGQNVRITADGTLTMRGWNGHVLPPATSSPTTKVSLAMVTP